MSGWDLYNDNNSDESSVTFTKSPLVIYQEKKILREKAERRQKVFEMLDPEKFDDCQVDSTTGGFKNVDLELFDTKFGMSIELGSMSSFSEQSDLSFGNSDNDDHFRGTHNMTGLQSVSGLLEVKNTLLNVFIYPLLYPQLFPDNMRWSSVLLYGAPGTGKTMLAKAVAHEIGAHIECISGSDILSKWQGESEKQIRSLFQKAKERSSPTLLFFDEIDGLCRKRNSEEAETVRRVKTELLVQFDSTFSCSRYVYIIGATNCPWDIDCAFLRRFHQKIHVPLLDKSGRIEVIQGCLQGVDTALSDTDWDTAGEVTAGFCTSDLRNIVMSACCERMQQALDCSHWLRYGSVWFPALPGTPNSKKMNFADIPPQMVGARSLRLEDIETAVRNTHSSVNLQELQKYEMFKQNNK